MAVSPDSRFPRRLYRRGAEPDPRFSLANERTFLSWIRTALAMLAAGVALEALDFPAQPGLRMAASLAFISLGLLAAVQAWVGWLRTESSLRDNRALPGPTLGLVVVVGVVAAVVCVLAGALL